MSTLLDRHWDEPVLDIRHDDTENVDDGRCLACERLAAAGDEAMQLAAYGWLWSFVR